MAQKKEEKEEFKLPVEKKSTFPKLKIGFSVIVTAAAITDLLGLYDLSKLVIDILLLLTGLWLLKSAISSGFSKSHREILKRYI